MPPARVYACVRDPDQLPEWAPAICKSVTVNDGIWHVDTGGEMGTVQLIFCADNAFGVLDHTVTLPDGSTTLNPVRVVANGEGSELTFTLFQHEDMCEEAFLRDIQAVTRDLKTLKVMLERAQQTGAA